MSKPKVWVIKEQVRSGVTGPLPMDYTPAMEYGEVEFVTEFDMPLHSSSTISSEWVKRVKAWMHVYDPDKDWLVLTGHTISIFLIAAALGRTNLGTGPKILVWRREMGRYIPFNGSDILDAIGQ